MRIASLDLPEWIADAITDSFAVVLFLFLIFVFVEIIEYFFSNKINSIVKKSSRFAPLIGSLAAIFPQCGFSVMASTLYIKKYITKGTLIAIYLATSDEAIPILLAHPEKMYYVIPLVITKLLIAIIAGYAIDFILKENKYIFTPVKENILEDGCCHHGIVRNRKRDLIFHPIKHTLNIFCFILIITLILNGLIELAREYSILKWSKLFDVNILMPFIAAIVGLIPNCAISIALTMLLIKGTITFGAAIAGLLANGGIGVLILIKKNPKKKDTLKIISILLIISIVCGYIIQFFE